MAKSEKGWNLKDRLQDAVQTTKNAIENVDLSEVKERVQEAGEAAKEAVKNVKVPDIDPSRLKDVFKKDVDQSSPARKANSTLDADQDQTSVISTKSALKIIYFVMAADGIVFDDEDEKFKLIGKELDPQYEYDRDEIIGECQQLLDERSDSDYQKALQEGIENALTQSKQTEDSFITPKLLLWDLLTVAYSDKQYNEAEIKVLEYLVNKLNIDKAVFVEMENCIQTLLSLEQELQWIKTTDRPYLTIEAMVNEIVDRKQVIFDSAKALIEL